MLDKLHVQRNKWRPRNKNDLCQSFYYVNDKTKMDGKIPQIMKCYMCYKNPIDFSNSRIQLGTCIIIYYKTIGIIALEKRVNVDHVVIAIKFKHENVEKQLAKKRPNAFGFFTSKFLLQFVKSP